MIGLIFAETIDILLWALEVLYEESEPLGLLVSSVKTKIQAFNDILDAAILSVHVCGEDVEVTERFTFLGSDIHASSGCEPEVNRRLGQAWRVMDSLDHGVWRCRYLRGRTKVQVFMSLVLPVLERDGDGPGICLGDCRMEALGVPAESGRSDALLRRMLPYLT